MLASFAVSVRVANSAREFNFNWHPATLAPPFVHCSSFHRPKILHVVVAAEHRAALNRARTAGATAGAAAGATRAAPTLGPGRLQKPAEKPHG